MQIGKQPEWRPQRHVADLAEGPSRSQSNGLAPPSQWFLPLEENFIDSLGPPSMRLALASQTSLSSLDYLRPKTPPSPSALPIELHSYQAVAAHAARQPRRTLRGTAEAASSSGAGPTVRRLVAQSSLSVTSWLVCYQIALDFFYPTIKTLVNPSAQRSVLGGTLSLIFGLICLGGIGPYAGRLWADGLEWTERKSMARSPQAKRTAQLWGRLFLGTCVVAMVATFAANIIGPNNARYKVMATDILLYGSPLAAHTCWQLGRTIGAAASALRLRRSPLGPHSDRDANRIREGIV